MVVSSRSDRSPRARVVAVVAAVLLAAVGLGAGVALVNLVALVLPAVGVPITRGLSLVLSLVFVQGIGVLLVAGAYLWWTGRGRSFVGVRVPTTRDLVWIVSGYVLAMVANFGVGIARLLLGVESAQNSVIDIVLPQPELLLLLIPASFLLVGPGEELLFRGIVQGRLRESFGPIVGIGLATLIFIVVHYPSLTGTPEGRAVYIAGLALPALVFAVAYEATDNVVVPAVIHGAYNATLFALAYVALTYAPEGGTQMETAAVEAALLFLPF
ncbi:CPBP family intramembrane glutamic endopeptidase [Halomarina ordinaria]|uniref:CPBP family intramembrane glutamic endopeptidase n=1 Tax=Halomarina ordinaria TaxID=3033939 RepID=A0ABD5U6T9_9EURY|nr:type II CAAX endopeptidase family protein [Halomarina sp. PSRA2]